MRLVNWNIEWMNDWFIGGGHVGFRQVNDYKGITNVPDLCKRVANVITKLHPDIITIEEGPSDIREMELFTNTYLVDNQNDPEFDVFGGIDGGSQKVYALVKKDGTFQSPRIIEDEFTLKLQEPWEIDIDADYQLEGYEFTRQPLIMGGTIGSEGSPIQIIALHTKSKYVNQGASLWNDPNTRVQYVMAALKNRRRISAEAMRVRQYVDELLTQDENIQIIVTGDFNDGPGIDFFEQHYMTHNITDILLGSTYYPTRLFRHPIIESVPETDRFTAVFDDFIDNIANRHLLLDHIIVSPALTSIQQVGIAHLEYNEETDNQATTNRQKFVSDHRPVYMDLAS